MENTIHVYKFSLRAAGSRAMLINSEHASIGEMERKEKHAFPGQFDPPDLEDRGFLNV